MSSVLSYLSNCSSHDLKKQRKYEEMVLSNIQFSTVVLVAGVGDAAVK